MGKIVKERKRKKNSYTHAENRLKICFFFLRKVILICEIKAVLKDKIIQAFPKFCSKNDISDDRFLAVICCACTTKLYKKLAGKQTENFKIPDEYKNFFETRKVITRTTIIQETCGCKLCEIILDYNINQKNLLSKKSTKKCYNSKRVIERRCSKCFNLIERGIKHDCNSDSKKEFLKKLSTTSSVRNKKIIQSSIF